METNRFWPTHWPHTCLAVLVLGVLVLLFHRPDAQVTTQHRVECVPLLGAYLSEEEQQIKESAEWGGDWTSEPDAVQACDERRDTDLALLALMAVPISILASWFVTNRVLRQHGLLPQADGETSAAGPDPEGDPGDDTGNDTGKDGADDSGDDSGAATS